MSSIPVGVPTTIPNCRAWWRGYGDPNAGTVHDFSGNVKPLTKAASTASPSIVAPCFECNSAAAVKFYATNSQYATSSETAGWSFLSASGGSTGVLRFVEQYNTTGVLLSNFGSSFANGSGILVYLDANRFINLYVSRGGVALGTYIAGTALQLGAPQTVVWRVNPVTGKLNVRVNGVQVNDSALNPFVDTDASFPLRMGMYSAPTNNNPFGGMISECILYDRSLSDAEVGVIETWLSTEQEPPAAWAGTTAAVPGTLPAVARVMFVGDSVMEGSTGTILYLGGARQYVQVLQGGDGFTIDQVGPYVGQLTPNGYSENQSDSVGGSVIKGDVASAGHLAGSVPLVAQGPIGFNVTRYDPHVLVLMLGVNNLAGVPDATTYLNDNSGDWMRLVLEAYAAKPSLRFVLGSVSNIAGDTLNIVPTFNRALASAVTFLRAMGIRIVQADDTINPATDTSDGKHLNDTGAVVLGTVFYAAIKRALGLP